MTLFLRRSRTPGALLAELCETNNLSYGIFISQLVRLARINSTLKGFKNCVTELLGTLVTQQVCQVL